MSPGPQGYPAIIPANVDMAALRSELLADHVAAPADQEPELRSLVARAKSDGYELNVVVLTESQPNFTYYRDIATELQSQVGGTVLVIGPNSVGSASNEFSRVVQEQAMDDLTLQKPTVAATQMYDELTAPQIDWTLVTIVLILVTIVGAVLARVRSVRARRRRGEDAAVVVDQGRPDTRGSSGLGEQTAESAADRTADSSAT
ncbi:hypothetical protein LK459_21815 [Gordonia otitidis]|uniref:Rv1476 family membrane protein n=1 Tax=Gordonia otitidis TaxID=249058 RepID=UPI001D14144A|nr:DUF6676 family protein [Gordonia otitidis]UEA59119.1 hypothetical protein LK459_21815 [Gordonia otitidis]